MREAKRDLVGVAVFDRLDAPLPSDPYLHHQMWQRRELEGYLCQKDTLLAFATAHARDEAGDLFSQSWRETMAESIRAIEAALEELDRPSPWGPDLKTTDDFLDPLFARFYKSLRLPNLMRKTDYHRLAPFVAVHRIDPEVASKLDAIAEVWKQARPRLD